ncbi:MAG: MBL fold metallo-hydrolase [Desulfobacteraceae bacterium]|nr:MAG: MBL fold metallo-hydrolase [Desulfobacteraceae bacterium]
MIGMCLYGSIRDERWVIYAFDLEREGRYPALETFTSRGDVMQNHEGIKELDSHVLRLVNGAMYVDFVKTTQGVLRMGSMPDISKKMAQYGLSEDAVIVPKREVCQGGDNHTGEEFVQWHAQVFGGPLKPYIGTPESLRSIYENLAAVFPYYFDKKMLSVVRKRWLKKWVMPVPVESVYEQGPLRVLFRKDNIVILDEGRQIYDREEARSSIGAEFLVEEALSGVRRDSATREALEITVVGSGNGFFGTTASFVVRFGNHVLWVDPCAQPAHNLARVGLHWDDITEILISHNHEDHILGFAACLKRKMDRREKLRLITSSEIFRVLRSQYDLLFPELTEHVDLVPISPERTLSLEGLRLFARWNHHFLPYGTLGFKLTAGGKTCGFSGDVKFDTRINRILKREELTEAWFRGCDLLFHEVDFRNPRGVHSYWKEVSKIQNVLSGDLYGYHTAPQENPPIPIAQDGKTYVLHRN